MQHVTEYFDLDLSPIRNYLSGCKSPFDTSQLYSVSADAKFVDESIRKSKFRVVKDPVLFDLCDAVVRSLSARSSDTEYLLVRNDCTHIIYEKGGFFNAHADFLSLTSNLIEEHTLILSCAVPGAGPTKGGLTVIQPNPDATIESKASTTPNSGVMFRKDLTHSSTPLLEGDKTILTLNVWAFRKKTNEFVTVTFSKTPAVTASHSQSLLGGGTTEMYVLSSSDIEQFPGSALHTFLIDRRRAAAAAAATATATARTAERFYSYETNDYTYDEFNVLYHIYTRRYVSTERIAAASGLISRMGVASKLILLDADVNANTNGNANASTAPTQRTVATAATASAGSEKKLPFHPLNHETAANASAAAVAKPSVVSDNDDRCDFIICNGQSQFRALNHRAKALGLPYIPFRLLYAEGILAYGGGMINEPPILVKMLPVWFSIGDRDNIVGFRSLCKKTGFETSPNLTDTEFSNHLHTELKPEMLRGDLRVKFARMDKRPFAAAQDSGDNLIQTNAAVLVQPAAAAPVAAEDDATMDDELVYDLLLPYDDNSFYNDSATVTFNAQFALPDDSVSSIVRLCCTNGSSTDFWPSRVIAYPEGDSYQKSTSDSLPATSPSQKNQKTASAAAAAAAAAAATSSSSSSTAARATQDEAPDRKPCRDSEKCIKKQWLREKCGNVVFSASEAEQTSSRLRELNFPRRVQKVLQTIDFALPQQYSKVQSHFCNESIYGKFTFLECVGLIRLYTESDLLRYLTPVLPITELAEIVTAYCLGGDETDDMPQVNDGQHTIQQPPKTYNFYERLI